MIDYIEIEVLVGETAFVDILIAELSAIGFDTFEEIESGFKGYIPAPDYDVAILESILTPYSESTYISYSEKVIKGQNWNAEWEKNFPPVLIADKVFVRASFHEPKPEIPFEIVINPKMSFGTGHHATTSLMIESQLGIDHKGKTVLDAGTGTGVLAIMAEKLGASAISAYDIDPWPVENTIENLALNNCTKATVWQGTAPTLVTFEPFDIVLANINKNVLLDEMTHYYRFLKNSGVLLLSGFYDTDIEDLISAATHVGFKHVKSKVSDAKWSLLQMEKQ
jgi:ribosomal protein L11 methyltransferase